MIIVNPDSQLRENLIFPIDPTVSVTTLGRFVEYTERSESVGTVGGRLSSECSEQFATVVNDTISISI
jgi:hypothetical protein